MEKILSFLSFIFIPKFEIYQTNPGFYWILTLIAGFLWSLVLLGVFGIWYYFFSGYLDYWKDQDRSDEDNSGLGE